MKGLLIFPVKFSGLWNMPLQGEKLLRSDYMSYYLLEASNQLLSNKSWSSALPSSHFSTDGKS